MVELTVRPRREEIVRALGNDYRIVKAFEGLFDAQEAASSATQFLDTPDLSDQTQSDFFYFGWESVNNDWLVRRQSRVNSAYEDANSTNNSIYSDLSSAWPNRTSLTYG